MSLTGALSSAISALAAQSQALAMVGDNIANADTTGYKTTSPLFEQMVTASNTATSYSSGGVSVLSRANITQQGLLAASSTPTDVAIQGAGFFVVSNAAASGTTFFTRNGAFTPDKNGLLQNDGFFLQGWRTDPSGNVIGGENPSSLTTINTEIAPVSAGATTKATIPTNLPADAPVSTTTPPTPFGTSSMTVYDSLGTPSTIQVSWTKTASNIWTATFGNPSSTSDSTVTTGTTTGGPFTLTFDGTTGKLSNVAPVPTLSVAWNDGAGPSSIALDMTSMTQFASGQATPVMDNATIETDGFVKGELTNVTIGKNDGVVSATYSNGQTIPIYKIAVATFSDPTGLAANSDGMYTATGTSGNATYQASGEGAAGTVFGSELESSTTDTSGQFSNMISAQQAYSAASQVITTVNKMYDTLMSAMR
jgi:flagellar hook protein FlgE